MARHRGELSDMDLLEYCPNCDEPLYRSPAARPPAKFKLLALLIIIGAIVLWPVLAALAFGLLATGRAPVRTNPLFVLAGITALCAGIGAWALKMPRVRNYRCRECGWAGGIATNWRK